MQEIKSKIVQLSKKKSTSDFNFSSNEKNLNNIDNNWMLKTLTFSDGYCVCMIWKSLTETQNQSSTLKSEPGSMAACISIFWRISAFFEKQSPREAFYRITVMCGSDILCNIMGLLKVRQESCFINTVFLPILNSFQDFSFDC